MCHLLSLLDVSSIIIVGCVIYYHCWMSSIIIVGCHLLSLLDVSSIHLMQAFPLQVDMFLVDMLFNCGNSSVISNYTSVFFNGFGTVY